MPSVPFTELTIRSLKPGVHYDARTPAFGIRIGKQKKTWLIIKGKTRAKIVIGHYPDMGLADARTAARRLLVQASNPKPPAFTFDQARTRYLAEHKGRHSTKRELTRLLTKKFAALDNRDLSEIADKDIQRQIIGLPPSEALHAFRAIRAAFRWFTQPPRRYLPHSPLEGYAPPSQDRTRSRILTDVEIKNVLAAATGHSGAAIKLILLWGTRKGETLALRRDWVADNVLTIPGTVTKNGRPLTIPVLPLAKSVLDGLPHRGEHFFAGARNHQNHIDSATWTRMHKLLLVASETQEWTAHDARRTFRSACARLGVRREIAEILLNHAQGKLDAIYDHYDYLNEKIEALAKIEDWLSGLMPQRN